MSLNNKINPGLYPGYSGQQFCANQNANSPNVAYGAGAVDTIVAAPKNAADSNPAFSMAQGIIGEDPKGLLLKFALPVFAVFATATSFINHFMKGDYKDSILGKMTSFGEKIEQNVIYKNTAGRGIAGLKSFGGWFSKNVVDKSQILTSVVKTPAKPEWDHAKASLYGIKSPLGHEAVKIINKYIGNAPERLKALGLSEEIFKNIQKDPVKYREALYKALEEGSKAGKYVDFNKIWGIPLPRFLSKRVYFNELMNKSAVINGLGPVKGSLLGRFLPRSFMLGLEGLTNSTTGGKIAIAIHSIFIAQSVREGTKAPKGDRFKTFVEHLTSFVAMMATIPLASAGMYALGGLKNIGINPEKVKEFEKEVKKINAQNAVGFFETKKLHTEALTKAKELIKAPNKNIFLRILHFPFKIVGKIAQIGLNNFLPWNNKAAGINTSIFTKMGNVAGTAKRWMFGPFGRIVISMAIISPILSNMAVRFMHLIVGRPKKSILDKEAEPAKTDSQDQPQQQHQQTVMPTITNMQSSPAGNLLTAAINKTLASQNIAAESEKDDQEPPTELPRTYVPSSYAPAVNLSAPSVETADKSVQDILLRADKIQARASKFLKA